MDRPDVAIRNLASAVETQLVDAREREKVAYAAYIKVQARVTYLLTFKENLEHLVELLDNTEGELPQVPF